MMDRLTLNVCQGVGDIFWVYQKFAPYAQKLNFNICVVGNGVEEKIQERAMPFLKLWRQVDQVSTKVVTVDQYDRLITVKYSVPSILNKASVKPEFAYDYSCNRPLEEGVRLEEIDPSHPILETVPIELAPPEPIFHGDPYWVLYVSGSQPAMTLWSIGDWVELVEALMQKTGTQFPILMVGASYDEGPIVRVRRTLVKRGHLTEQWIDQPPARVLSAIAGSRFFVGYQSGLSILADNLDVPQMMLYIPRLEKMLYSWCKKGNRESGLYNAALLTERPQAVADKVELDWVGA